MKIIIWIFWQLKYVRQFILPAKFNIFFKKKLNKLHLLKIKLGKLQHNEVKHIRLLKVEMDYNKDNIKFRRLTLRNQHKQKHKRLKKKTSKA